MQFIRYQTENRTLLSILFVSFLCLTLLSVGSFISAGGPLLIFGYPAAQFIAGVAGAALTFFGVLSAAEMLHKDLEEKIQLLDDDIKRLTITKQGAETAKEKAKTEEKDWKAKNVAAEKAVATAKTNQAEAQKTFSAAEYEYKQAARVEQWALDYYRGYTATSSNDSEKKRRYDSWQAAKESTTSKSTALDTATTDLSNKESDLSDAWDNFYTVGGTYGQYKLKLELATNLFNSAKAALDIKAAELASKKVEKTINVATSQNALGQTESAIYTLDTAETNFPEAWNEAMEDPDLAAQVKEVRDKWNKKNQETENGEQ